MACPLSVVGGKGPGLSVVVAYESGPKSGTYTTCGTLCTVADKNSFAHGINHIVKDAVDSDYARKRNLDNHGSN